MRKNERFGERVHKKGCNPVIAYKKFRPTLQQDGTL